MPGFDFNNTNTGPVFHGQPVGNRPMGQAVTNIPRSVGNSNTMNSGTAVHGQPVDNWPMGQAQTNMPLGSLPQPRQGQRQPPRPISVIDASIEHLRALGRQAEGDMPTLIYLGNQISALNNERHESVKAEKKEASRRRARETGDHLESSPAPKRQKRATAAAAADETSPETSSGESSHEFTLSPAATATATAMPRPEPIQQQSFTSNFMLPPGAVFINPAAAAAATTAAAATPEPIQQQSSTNSGIPSPGAVLLNPDAAAAAAAARAHVAANAADLITLTPLLDVVNGPEDTNELPMLQEVTGAAEEEHPQLMNDSLFGEGLMDLDDLFGTEGYFLNQNVAEMFPETIECYQAKDEAATEEFEMW